jgi:dTDP-4-amino-4,6-dideoxygalactose transaminase
LPMISVFGSAVGKEELDEVAGCMEAQWMGAGAKVKEFEGAFAERLKLPNFAMVNSGSNALYLAVKILGLPAGSQVILPSFTWIACAQAVLLCGCEPVFCDVDLDTHNVTAETIRPHITSQTAAIMVVHYAGKPVNMAPILALGFPVIEDAAHAVDSAWRGTACGAIGDIGIYSFDSVKNIASPDAGGITVHDAALFNRARGLLYCGIEKSGFAASGGVDRWWEYAIRGVGPKLLSNDVCAAIALAQLRKLDRHQSRRRQIWELFQTEFRQLHWLSLPSDPGPWERHSYFTYCVRLTATGDRDRFARFLYDRGIYTTLRYHPLHLNAIYSSKSILPKSVQLNEQALSLPLHTRLSDADLDQIISAVRAFPQARAATA